MRQSTKQVDFNLSFLADPELCVVARSLVSSVCEMSGYEKAITDDLRMAVGEAVQNALRYGSPRQDSRITLAITRLPNGIELTVGDEGKPFDLRSCAEQYLGNATMAMSEYGRGMRLIVTLVDRVCWRTTPIGTLCSMFKSFVRIEPCEYDVIYGMATDDQLSARRVAREALCTK